jgi:hypothetical protein
LGRRPARRCRRAPPRPRRPVIPAATGTTHTAPTHTARTAITNSHTAAATRYHAHVAGHPTPASDPVPPPRHPAHAAVRDAGRGWRDRCTGTVAGYRVQASHRDTWSGRARALAVGRGGGGGTCATKGPSTTLTPPHTHTPRRPFLLRTCTRRVSVRMSRGPATAMPRNDAGTSSTGTSRSRDVNSGSASSTLPNSTSAAPSPRAWASTVPSPALPPTSECSSAADTNLPEAPAWAPTTPPPAGAPLEDAGACTWEVGAQRGRAGARGGKPRKCVWVCEEEWAGVAVGASGWVGGSGWVGASGWVGVSGWV